MSLVSTGLKTECAPGVNTTIVESVIEGWNVIGPPEFRTAFQNLLHEHTEDDGNETWHDRFHRTGEHPAWDCGHADDTYNRGYEDGRISVLRELFRPGSVSRPEGDNRG